MGKVHGGHEILVTDLCETLHCKNSQKYDCHEIVIAFICINLEK